MPGQGSLAVSVSLILLLLFCPRLVGMEPTATYDTGPEFWLEAAAETTRVGEESDCRQQLVTEIIAAEGDGGIFLEQELNLFQTGPSSHLVGRVKNRSGTGAELILITWEVGTRDKKIAASAGVYIRGLNPGESKPFKLMLPYRPDITRSQVRITPGFKSKPQPVRLVAVTELYADRGQAYLSLLGHVTNKGGEREDLVKVVVEFLDKDGKLLDVDWAFLNYLDPGASQSFTVYTPRLETRTWNVYFD